MNETEFIPTSLHCVRQTQQRIESLETYLMSDNDNNDNDTVYFFKYNVNKLIFQLKYTGLASGPFINMIIYGGLMCQHVKAYDEFTYTQCGVLHKWIPFGCLIQVNENQSVKDVVNVLNKAGYAARLREQTTDQLQIFMNSKLLETLTNFGFDREKIELEEDTLYNIIKKKKEIMKTGQVEGFVITFESEKQRKKIIKWKGATEFQPMSLTR